MDGLAMAAPDPIAQHCRIEKPWGWEVLWADTAQYAAKFLHIRAGCRLSLQYHDGKTETQCLLSGSALLLLEDGDGAMSEITMQPGVGYTILPYRAHRLIALTDSEIAEVATPERGTTVRLSDDYDRGDETEAIRALPNRGWAQPARALAGEASSERMG